MTARAKAKRTIVIADDLTGGADCQSQIWPRARTRLRILDAQPEPAVLRADLEETDVLVLDTEARFAPPGETEARLRTAFAAVRAVSGGDARVYLKVDSTLRGDIAAHIRVAAEVFAPGTIPVVLAHPAEGRTTRDGRQHVDGVPVELSAAGSDPAHPVASSLVIDHLGGADATVLDAGSAADLERIAVELEDARVVCGASGLLRYLVLEAYGSPAPPPHARRPLVVCGSLHPRAIEQVAAVAGECAVVAAQPASDDGGRELAERAAALDEREGFDALVLVGGRTAFHVCRRFGIEALDLAGATAAGLPVCSTLDRSRAVVLKPGGFGGHDALRDCVRELAANG